MKVAILFDVPNWAYHNEALGLQKYLKQDGIDSDVFSFGLFYSVKSNTSEYDAVFLYPRQAKGISYPVEKTAVKFSSYGKFDYTEEFNGLYFKWICCTSRDIQSKVAKATPSKANVLYMPLAIDTDCFYPKDITVPKKLRIGFAGNAKREIKNFYLIKEAEEKTNNLFDWKFATYHGDSRIFHKDVPDFMRSIDLFVCMSDMEGGPLTAFEAGCCGVPTVTCCERSAIFEVITNGYNGFIVDKSSDSLINKIMELDLNREKLIVAKENIAYTMYYHHSWKFIIKLYSDLFKRIGGK